jgi:hypothetical protein
MISKNNPKSLSDWIRKKFSDDHDTMLLLAEDFIERNDINWSSPEERKSLEEYLSEFNYKPEGKTEGFLDGFRKHSSVYQPFELNNKDFDSGISSEAPMKSQSQSVMREDEHTDTLMDFDSDSKEFDGRIERLPFPAEVKELLKELEDKSYKSPILANFDTLGRLKLTRKAKVLAFLHRQNIL